MNEAYLGAANFSAALYNCFCLQSVLHASSRRAGGERGLRVTSVMSSLANQTSATKEPASLLNEDTISLITRGIYSSHKRHFKDLATSIRAVDFSSIWHWMICPDHHGRNSVNDFSITIGLHNTLQLSTFVTLIACYNATKLLLFFFFFLFLLLL